MSEEERQAKKKELKKEKRDEEFKKRRQKVNTDTEGNTLTNSPGQTFKRGEQITGTEAPDTDMRTGERIYGDEEDEFGNPVYNPYRLGASITTEIGLNLLLDVFSAAPPVQAVGSAWINYLAQKIRGETDINKLEMTAASIASQIPLLGSFKGATQAGKFGKGVLQGAVTGAIEETGYSLGRGEEANIPEAALFGATVGGIFNSRNAPDFFDSIKGKLTKNTPLVTPQGITFDTPDVPNTAFAIKGKGSQKGCLLYTSPSPRDGLLSRMPSSA